MAGASEEAEGDDIVTDARRSVGLPHEGQNFFDASLQILHRNERFGGNKPIQGDG